MSEPIEFEQAPAKRIWQSLLDVADDLRVHRMVIEAHQMMSVVRCPTICGERFPACDPRWREFLDLIEAEEKRREEIASDVQSDARNTLLFPVALDEVRLPQILNDVKGIQPPAAEFVGLLKSA